MTIAATAPPTYLVISAGALVVGVIAIAAYRYWPRRRPPAPRAATAETEIDEPPAERHVRTPSDVLHLIVGVLLVLLGLLIAAGASNTLVGFERDTISAFDALPEALARGAVPAVPGRRLAHPRRRRAGRAVAPQVPALRDARSSRLWSRSRRRPS